MCAFFVFSQISSTKCNLVASCHVVRAVCLPSSVTPFLLPVLANPHNKLPRGAQRLCPFRSGGSSGQRGPLPKSTQLAGAGPALAPSHAPQLRNVGLLLCKAANLMVKKTHCEKQVAFMTTIAKERWAARKDAFNFMLNPV